MAIFFWWKRTRKEKPEDWFEDKPISKDENDYLNFRHFIDPLASLIAQRRTPLTIGIYGEWGSGKTSFLGLLSECLQKHYAINPIWFNAWKYDKKDNLWAALIQTVLNQAGKQGSPLAKIGVKFRLWLFKVDIKAGSWEVTKKLLMLLLRAVIIVLCVIAGIKSADIAKALTRGTSSISFIPTGVSTVIIAAFVIIIGIVALDPEKLFSLFMGDIHFDFSKFERELSFRAHIAFFDEFSEQFQDLINLLHPRDKPLVIIIDDLDRCLPAHMLQVLEAIKVFLDSTNCVFLLGVDKEMIETAAAARFKYFSEISSQLYEKKDSTPHRRKALHGDYLDKIISLALAVPRPSQKQVGEFIRKLNNDEDGKIPFDEDVKQCTAIFNAGLPPNLRKIKRTLYSFRFVRDLCNARIESGESQIKAIEFPLLAKLIVIQNQFARLYEDVINQPSLLSQLEKGFAEHPADEQSQSIEYKTAKIYEDLYGSELKELLLQDVDTATFADKTNILQYISLIGSLAEIGPLEDKRTPLVDSEGPSPAVQKVASSFPVPAQPAAPVASPSGTATLKRIPRRNPRFTAREDILHVLKNSFFQEQSLRNTYIALTGLGGIGKTQIALEYAYRFSNDYATILWVRSETREMLLSDYITIAEELGITDTASMQRHQDQNSIRDAVKSWLGSQSGWLLIYDDVNDLDIVQEFFPPPRGGHIMITTRMKIAEKGISCIVVDTLEVEESIRLLLLRTGMITPRAMLTDISIEEYNKAATIVSLLGGLPLAIDQAGAYIEETRCGLDGYLDLYKSKHAELLNRRSSRSDYPKSVAAALSLSFKEIEREFPAAWELLRLCAFLTPDNIPLELFTKDAANMGSALKPLAQSENKLMQAIDELEKFSLVRLDSGTLTLSIHRLVQDVLKAEMDEQEQRERANRALLLIYHAFPDTIGPETWKECQRYLSQALGCINLVEQRSFFSVQALVVAAHVLDRAGRYLRDRAQYDRAEELFYRALQLLEEELGQEDPDFLSSLKNLATLYNAQGRYADAESLLKRGLDIQRQILGNEHPDVATTMNEIALIYLGQGRYAEAENLFKDALAILEKTLGPEHPDVATIMNNLASLYSAQGQYAEAEKFFEVALDICRKVLAEDHPLVASSLNNLAGLYSRQGQYDKAIVLFEEALAIRKKVLGERHPDIAIILTNLAELYAQKGNLEQARRYYEEALTIHERAVGTDSQTLMPLLASYAALLRKFREERLDRQAEKIEERVRNIQELHEQGQ